MITLDVNIQYTIKNLLLNLLNFYKNEANREIIRKGTLMQREFSQEKPLKKKIQKRLQSIASIMSVQDSRKSKPTPTSQAN